jgi:prepilin-type processing-associated H-X9-DG protein
MILRPWIRPFAVLLLVSLAALPACNKKKKTEDGGGTPEPRPEQVPAAASANSDYVLFAHFRAKDIRDSAVFAEIKEALAKSGGQAEWDQIEKDAAKSIGGIKPTEIDSVTALVMDVPMGGIPKFIVIVTTAKPIDRTALQDLMKSKPDASGFHTMGVGGLMHFPDEKTFVLLHPDLKQKYLDGYAKNRTGWPLNSDLTRAAGGHTLYAVVNVEKLPKEIARSPEAREFAGALTARSVTLTADLRGKELSVAARATFPDAASAGQAKDTVQKFRGMALGEIDKVMSGKGPPELAGFMPAVKEAHRALSDAKVEVTGSDLIVSGSYKANFDVGAMVAEAVKKVREAATRMTEANNLKQIGLALHNYHDSNGRVPIGAVGAKGAVLQNPKDKPLLSWRVALLPYIEQEPLYREFKLDEPWDSAHNKKLIEKMPKIYAPPKAGKPGMTHLQMVVGPNAMPDQFARFPASFPDGMSNTIAVIEAAEPVIWTKPDDVKLTGKEMPIDLRKKFGGQFPGGFNVVMWDGSVRFVKDSVSDTTLSRALNPRDGQPLGSDW